MYVALSLHLATPERDGLACGPAPLRGTLHAGSPSRTPVSPLTKELRLFPAEAGSEPAGRPALR